MVKPSLHKFLVSLPLKGAKKIGEDWKSYSTQAWRRRKYIRDNEISDEELENIQEEFKNRKNRPYSSLSYIELKEHRDGSIGYTINVPEKNITEVYLDILDAVVKGHKEIKRRKST